MFQPLNSSNSTATNYNQVNNMVRQLNKEQTVKTYKQENGNAIVTGRYMENRYGTVYYDENGIPNILIGQAPDDGRPGIWAAPVGTNVLTLLGG